MVRAGGLLAWECAGPELGGVGEKPLVALLHHFKRLAVRWERRTELHDAFVSLACSLICWR
ncbi:hypothetical protein ABZ648_34525, partial [Streptomyces sp. NPDC007094]